MKRFNSPKTPTRTSITYNNSCTTYENGLETFSDLSAACSLTTSRYGRTRKPKISEDFCDIDDALLHDSPPAPILPIKSYSIRKSNTPSQNSIATSNGPEKKKNMITVPDPEHLDVNDVLKIVANANPKVPKMPYLSASKNQVKTYHNKRKSYNFKNHVNESFGLPDSPIEERKYDFQIKPSVNSTIDINYTKAEEVRIDNKIFSASNPWECELDDIIFVDEKKLPKISVVDSDDFEAEEKIDPEIVVIKDEAEELTSKLCDEIQISSLSAKLQQAIHRNQAVKKNDGVLKIKDAKVIYIDHSKKKRIFSGIASKIPLQKNATPLKKTIIRFDKRDGKITSAANRPVLLKDKAANVNANQSLATKQTKGEPFVNRDKPKLSEPLNTNFKKTTSKLPELLNSDARSDLVDIEEAEIIFIDDIEENSFDISDLRLTTVKVEDEVNVDLTRNADGVELPEELSTSADDFAAKEIKRESIEDLDEIPDKVEARSAQEIRSVLESNEVIDLAAEETEDSVSEQSEKCESVADLDELIIIEEASVTDERLNTSESSKNELINLIEDSDLKICDDEIQSTKPEPKVATPVKMPDAIQFKPEPKAATPFKMPDAIQSKPEPKAGTPVKMPDAIQSKPELKVATPVKMPDAIHTKPEPKAATTIKMADAIQSKPEPKVAAPVKMPNAIQYIAEPKAATPVKMPDAIQSKPEPKVATPVKIPDAVQCKPGTPVKSPVSDEKLGKLPTTPTSDSPDSKKTRSRKSKHEVRDISDEINFDDEIDDGNEVIAVKTFRNDVDEDIFDDICEEEIPTSKDPDFKIPSRHFKKVQAITSGNDGGENERRSIRFEQKQKRKTVEKGDTTNQVEILDEETNKTLPAAKSTDETAVDVKQELEEGSAEAKRKRGRPRKDSKVEHLNDSSDATEEVLVRSALRNRRLMNKKMGRPRKMPMVRIQKLKKKLGRPKKFLKRPRGRPRKMPVMPKPIVLQPPPEELKIKLEKEEAVASKEDVLESEKAAAKNKDEEVDAAETEESEAEVEDDAKDPKLLSPIVKTKFKLGDLCWGRIGWYPFWPCLIIADPDTKEYYKLHSVGRSLAISYHVRFFADNGSRSWILGQNVMLFKSGNDLQALAKKLKAEENPSKTTKDMISACFVNSQKTPKWNNAVEEAASLLNQTEEEREDFFWSFIRKANSLKRKLDVASASGGNTNEKKRKKVSVDLVSTLPRVKKEKENERATSLPLLPHGRRSFKTAEKEQESKKKPSENKETVTSSRKTAKKNLSSAFATEETQQTQKRKSITRRSDAPFQAYVRNNIKLMRREHPDLKDPALESMLKKLWENLEPDAKKIYNNTKGGLNGDADYAPSDTDTSSKDTNAKDSATTASAAKAAANAASLESLLVKLKRNFLFRGVSREKVCQICEKAGDVFKCKGTCGGLFHVKCMEEAAKSEFVGDTDTSLTSDGCEITSSCAASADDKNSSVTIVEVKKEEGEEVACATEPHLMNPDKENDHASSLSVSGTSVLQESVADACKERTTAKVMLLEEQIDAKLKEVMQDIENITKYADSTTDDGSSSSATETDSTISPVKSKSSKNAASNAASKVIKHVTADVITFDSDDEVASEVEKPTAVVVTSSEVAVNAEELMCKQCSDGIVPLCFACGKATSKAGNSVREKCSLFQCGKYYHHDCLKAWPQTMWTHTKRADSLDEDAFTCPLHFCHTCVSDDPRGATSRCPNDKIAKCLYCPTTYHNSAYCVPAGTEILSQHQIVCAKHYVEKAKSATPEGGGGGGRKRRSMKNVNASWCFICAEGGSLICCETCPTSFHAECLKISPPEDSFICEDCESGRFPLYNEIAWVKLGAYRWWPAIILYPTEIPENVRAIKHNRGEFAVRFFGTHDHYWVNRGRVFIFQEGDTGNTSAKKTQTDGVFLKAIGEAAAASKVLRDEKERRTEEFRNNLKPPKYIKIKGNRPVGNVKLVDGNTSNTTPCDCDPDSQNPCGPDSDCLNRILMTECDPMVCPAGSRCNNQRFEKRMYPPLVPYKTQGRGWGLKVLTALQKSDFIIEYVGEMIDETEYQRRLQKMHEKKDENYYFLTIDKDRMLDAGPKGNVARFMNHSCQPNCETQKWTVNGSTRVGLFATEVIEANTELTFNYNLECVGEEKKICKCGAPNCSGFIGAKAKQMVGDGASKKSSKANARLQKRKQKRKAAAQLAQAEALQTGPCFTCGTKIATQDNTIAACNNKLCSRVFHLDCVGLVAWPDGKWYCPCHNCNICSKRTTRCCTKCTNSYCPSHSDTNIRYDKVLASFICSAHDKQKLVSQMSENFNSGVESSLEKPALLSEDGARAASETPTVKSFSKLNATSSSSSSSKTSRSKSTTKSSIALNARRSLATIKTATKSTAEENITCRRRSSRISISVPIVEENLGNTDGNHNLEDVNMEEKIKPCVVKVTVEENEENISTVASPSRRKSITAGEKEDATLKVDDVEEIKDSGARSRIEVDISRVDLPKPSSLQTKGKRLSISEGPIKCGEEDVNAESSSKTSLPLKGHSKKQKPDSLETIKKNKEKTVKNSPVVNIREERITRRSSRTPVLDIIKNNKKASETNKSEPKNKTEEPVSEMADEYSENEETMTTSVECVTKVKYGASQKAETRKDSREKMKDRDGEVVKESGEEDEVSVKEAEKSENKTEDSKNKLVETIRETRMMRRSSRTPIIKLEIAKTSELEVPKASGSDSKVVQTQELPEAAEIAECIAKPSKVQQVERRSSSSETCDSSSSDEKNSFMKSLNIVERSAINNKRRSSRLVISTAAAAAKLLDDFSGESSGTESNCGVAEQSKSDNCKSKNSVVSTGKLNFNVSVVITKSKNLEKQLSNKKLSTAHARSVSSEEPACAEVTAVEVDKKPKKLKRKMDEETQQADAVPMALPMPPRKMLQVKKSVREQIQNVLTANESVIKAVLRKTLPKNPAAFSDKSTTAIVDKKLKEAINLKAGRFTHLFHQRGPDGKFLRETKEMSQENLKQCNELIRLLLRRKRKELSTKLLNKRKQSANAIVAGTGVKRLVMKSGVKNAIKAKSPVANGRVLVNGALAQKKKVKVVADLKMLKVKLAKKASPLGAGVKRNGKTATAPDAPPRKKIRLEAKNSDKR